MVKWSIKDTRQYRKFCYFLLRHIIPHDIFKDFKPSDKQFPYSELEREVQISEKRTGTLAGLLRERNKQCEELESKNDKLKRDLEKITQEFKYKHEQWSKVNRMQKHTIIQFQRELFTIMRPILKEWHSKKGELYDLILILDQDKKIAVANSKVIKHLGYSYEELLQMESCCDIVYFKDDLVKIMKGDYSFEDGIDLVTKEGKITHLKTHMRYVPSPEQPLFTCVFLRKEGRFERRHRINTGLYSGEARDGYREIVVPPLKDKKQMSKLYRELNRIKKTLLGKIIKPETKPLKREINLTNIQTVPKKLGKNLATVCKLGGSNLRITNAHISDTVYDDLIQKYGVPRENIYTKD
jgi:PAS domain-containing protein